MVSFKNKSHIITQKYKESGFKIEEQTEILGDDSESEEEAGRNEVKVPVKEKQTYQYK